MSHDSVALTVILNGELSPVFSIRKLLFFLGRVGKEFLLG